MGNATEAALFGPAPGAGPGFKDGLGERVIIAGAGPSEQLEILHLRRELTALSSFEFALRERAARLANFQHTGYARVRQIDRVAPPDGRLAVVSEHVPGWRLADILSAVSTHHLELDINAALCLIKQLVHGVSILHQHARGVAHGAIGPERLVVTPHARLVIVEYVLGSALERLEASRERLWREMRVAVPPSAGSSRFDSRTDVTQLGTVAMALVLGCPLASDDYPDHMAELLAMATENRTLGGRRPLSKPLRTWLARALQLDLRHSFNTAIQAEAELEAMLLAEPGYVTAPVALETFLGVYQRCIANAAQSEAAAEVAKAAEAVEAADAAEAAPPAMVQPPPVVLPASSESPATNTDDALDLDGVVVDLDAIFAEADSPKKPEALKPPIHGASRVEQPVVREAPRVEAPVKPANDSQARMPGFAPAPKDTSKPREEAAEDHGYPGGFEALFGSGPASQASAPKPQKDVEKEHPAPEAPEGEPRKGGKLRLVLAAAALLVVVIGGYFAYRLARPAAVPPATGTLLVQSQPAGLPVTIDGKPRGSTPLKMSLAPGSHELAFDNGGQQRKMTITISAGSQVSQYIEAQAAASTGRLQVTSEPAGASVFVDGERKGAAPVLVADLAVGRHAVELRSDDGSVMKQEVTIEPGATNSLVVPMSVAHNGPVSGWLSVTAPVELQVFEGSQMVGTSQTDRILITSGRHDLDLVNDTLGYRERRTVQVTPGRVVALKVQLPKGSLSVNAVPWAEVWVDGSRVGETPIGNLSLPIGPHEIIFRHPQFGEQRHAVTVTAGTPARVSVDLRK